MTRSPFSSFDRFSLRPLTSIPFVESRSTIQYDAPSWRSSAWRRETFGSASWTSHSRERPMTTRRFSTVQALAVPGERDALLLDPELGGRRRLGRLRLLARLVDHRVPGLGLRLRARRAAGPSAPLGLDHPGRDPELADVEVVVRVEHDPRRGQERVALPPRVLGEVALELVGERRLVVGELLAVLRREVDRVLVRDVDARDGDVLVVVHLLLELARELDRLHVRAEGTAEDALEEGLELLFDGSEHGAGGTFPEPSILSRPSRGEADAPT